MILGSIVSTQNHVDLSTGLSNFDEEIEWDFGKSIDSFNSCSIVRRVLTDETINLYTNMKKNEARESSKLGFNDEVTKLKAVI